MTRNRREQLRQMIREIVKEELARTASAKPDEREKAQGPQDSPSRPRPAQENRETAPPPPWALFGSPQPAPDGKEKTPFHNSRPHQLYKPEPTLNPPPFISGNRVSD